MLGRERERERERSDRDRDRDFRRSRSRDRNDRRDRGRPRSRSRSRSPFNRRKIVFANSSGPSGNHIDYPNDNLSDDEREMREVMGFGSFYSTKGEYWFDFWGTSVATGKKIEELNDFEDYNVWLAEKRQIKHEEMAKERERERREAAEERRKHMEERQKFLESENNRQGGSRRRSPSPYSRRRSPSPYTRRRSPSPYTRRRSPSPYSRRRSPSPYRRRSPSRHRRDDRHGYRNHHDR